MNNPYRNDEITVDIKEHIVVIARGATGWTKEVNIVSWTGGLPKVDIRDWDPNHERMTRGITLLETEAEELAKVLAKRFPTTGA